MIDRAHRGNGASPFPGNPMRALLIPLALVCAAPAFAAETGEPALSLDAVVESAIANNPERRFVADQIGFAQTQKQAAGRLADPQLYVDFGERKNADPVTGQVQGEGLAWSVAIVQPIEFGGRIALRRAIAEAQIDLARIGLEQFDATIAGRARSLGYALFAADEKAGAARIVAARMRNLANVTVQREAAGPAPALAAAILEAGAISAERGAAIADAEANRNLYALNQLRGSALDARLRIVRPTMALPVLPGPARLAEAILANNFELKALKAQLSQQGLQVDLARTARLPQLALGPYFEKARSDTRETNYGVRLQTTVPLWNGQAGTVATEKGRQAQANAALINAERQMTRQVQELASGYAARRAALAGWPVDAIARFDAAAADADHNYRLGAIPVATYVEMQRQYLDALAAVLDTRREAIEAEQQLRTLNAGAPLDGTIR